MKPTKRAQPDADRFSFDGVTWFDERGCCWYQGTDADYGYPTLRWMAEKYRDWGRA